MSYQLNSMKKKHTIKEQFSGTAWENQTVKIPPEVLTTIKWLQTAHLHNGISPLKEQTQKKLNYFAFSFREGHTRLQLEYIRVSLL